MANLLSLRPATAILGQERRRCQRNAGGGFDPSRGPSVACSTGQEAIARRNGKSMPARRPHEGRPRLIERRPASCRGDYGIPRKFGGGVALSLADLGERLS